MIVTPEDMLLSPSADDVTAERIIRCTRATTTAMINCAVREVPADVYICTDSATASFSGRIHAMLKGWNLDQHKSVVAAAALRSSADAPLRMEHLPPDLSAVIDYDPHLADILVRNMLISRSTLDVIGEFDEELGHMGAHEFLLRLVGVDALTVLPSVLCLIKGDGVETGAREATLMQQVVRTALREKFGTGVLGVPSRHAPPLGVTGSPVFVVGDTDAAANIVATSLSDHPSLTLRVRPPLLRPMAQAVIVSSEAVGATGHAVELVRSVVVKALEELWGGTCDVARGMRPVISLGDDPTVLADITVLYPDATYVWIAGSFPLQTMTTNHPSRAQATVLSNAGQSRVHIADWDVFLASPVEALARCASDLGLPAHAWVIWKDVVSHDLGEPRGGLERDRAPFVVRALSGSSFNDAVPSTSRGRIARPRAPGPYRDAHHLVVTHTPMHAITAVVSRGDEKAASLPGGREGRHFPETAAGVYVGYHPVNSDAAVRMLEESRGRGATHLLVPAVYSWWLDHYSGFSNHLNQHYGCVASDGDNSLFDLRPTNLVRDHSHRTAAP